MRAKLHEPGDITLTRRHRERLAPLAASGFEALDDNQEAVRGARIAIMAVQPQQMNALLAFLTENCCQGRCGTPDASFAAARPR